MRENDYTTKTVMCVTQLLAMRDKEPVELLAMRGVELILNLSIRVR